ncbi:protein eva-1 homolog C isoform X5 [Cetorhinus maximus]
MNARISNPASFQSIDVFLDLTLAQAPANTSLCPTNASLSPGERKCLVTSTLLGYPIGLQEDWEEEVRPGRAAQAVARETDEYKSKVACEGKELKLRCKNSTLINIYSATYGRMMNGNKACPSNLKLPDIECLSHTALEVVSTICYGKQSCKIIANSRYFGDPCFPGMQKYLHVIYVCVSKLLLQEADPSFSGLTPSWVYNGNVNKSLVPRESGFPMKGGKIVISTLVIFAYIKSNPEMVALLFVSSVCIGLIFTLCALVIRVSCRPDLQKICNRNSDDRKVDNCQDEDGNEGNNNDDEDESSDDNEESSSDFSFEGVTKLYGTLGSNSTEAAEIAERIERRDRIIQEIWMNGGSELPVIRNLNQYY